MNGYDLTDEGHMYVMYISLRISDEKWTMTNGNQFTLTKITFFKMLRLRNT